MAEAKKKLTQEELLALRNCLLRRELVSVRLQQQIDQIKQEQQVIEEKIAKRLSVKLQNFGINIDTGDVVPKAEVPKESAAGPALPAMPVGSPPFPVPRRIRRARRER